MKKIIAYIMTAVMLVSVFSCSFAEVSAASYKTWTDMGADYSESVASIENPDRGFYRTMYLFYNENTMTAQWPSYKFVHLRINLSSFSHNYLYKYGTAPDDYVENGYIPISDEYLYEIEQQLSNLRWYGATAVIRFAYDNFQGYGDCEPSMEGILYHISQLKPVLADFTDVLSSVESGFLGPWGEQHTSAIVTPENIKTLADAMLDAVPEPITVSVRRPLYYAYAVGVDVADLATHRATQDSKYYRLGVFNDGYLGSETDRGTYKNREIEVNWLDYQASHTLFGGEVASDHSSDGNVYNTVEFMSGEMFRTHTSYLNKEWNDSVISEWQNTTYNGDDELYNDLSGYTYIENHMGYRFVLTQAQYTSDGLGTQLSFKIKNVGAGNVLKDFKTSLVFVDSEDKQTEIETNIDIRDWKSLTEVTETVDVPSAKLKGGEYKVYLRIADPKFGMMRIQLANGNEYSTDRGSYLGKCNIVEDFGNTVIDSADEKPEILGIGGGGTFYASFVDPTNNNYYYATCDMGGFYWSHDAGSTWHRTETRGVFPVGCVSDNGTIFSGGYGLYASYDHGQSLNLIYPNADALHYSVSRMGGNENLMLADDFNNGYLKCVDTYGDKVYFITIDWYGEFRLVRCEFDGSNPETLYKYNSDYSDPVSPAFYITAEENGVYYADSTGVWYYELGASAPTKIYTPQGTISSFEKIGDKYFVLDDTDSETLVLYTENFTDFSNLNDFNTLSDQFSRYGNDYTFDWHFSSVKGNNFNSIFLAFYSPLSSDIGGNKTIYGVMKFDGNKFDWVFDSIFKDKSTADFTGWSYGSYGPIMSIANAPLDDNLCLMVNAETIYSMHFDGNDSTRSVRTLHCTEAEDLSCTTTGLDVQTTYSVHYDPFDSQHMIICTTDLGLQISYNGGQSWRRPENPNYEDIYNTCYDLYFDENTEGLVYGIWSSRHDVPFRLSTGDKTGSTGAFGVSRDGGITWDMYDYSSGIPSESIPCKMSVVPYGDKLMIAVATFNNGFYLSYDSGRTFTPINDSVESYDGCIWGVDIEIADDCIYMLTSYYNFGTAVPASLYRYTLADGTTEKIDMGKDVIIARTITYDEAKGLFINVIPYYRYQWFSEYNDGCFVNYGGGVYKLNSDDTVSLYFSNYDGIFDSAVSEDGSLYAVEPYGKVYVETSEDFRTFADGLFTQSKNICFSRDGEYVFVTTFGGGTYKLKTLENIRSGKVNNNSSIFSWDLFLMNDGDYPQTSQMLKDLNITRVYQEFPEKHLSEPETPKMVANLAADGIETVALAGDRSWGLADCDLSELKAHIDALDSYNQGIGSGNKITKLALDIETYTYSDWKSDPQTYFTAFIDKMAEVYTYAHSKGFDVIQVIPTHFDNISVNEFRRFLTTCCDEISLMNYTKSTQISAISGEVELCREMNMPVETIFETMPLNEHFSVTEDVTYFYEGFEALAAKRDKILDTYLYENLTASYHYYQTLYHVYSGNYFAEIYAYSSDETDKDYIPDLGQTTGLDHIVLTGDDGSVIKAYLYNPNKTAQYAEWCYLAVGVKKGVTYTITSGDKHYTVKSGNQKTVTLDVDDLIYYTSIGIDTVDIPQPAEYTVTVPENCTVTRTLPENSDYYLTTIQAPKTNANGDYFTYWVDGDGNIVGTYRTYSFYTVRDESFTPAYTPVADYAEARKTALYSSRVLDVRDNQDGTYSIFAEHCVSTTETIIGHGILVTTDSASADEETLICVSPSDEVSSFAARKTLSNRTGTFSVNISSTAQNVWARAYIIDGNGEIHYSQIRRYDFSAETASTDDEIILLDSQSVDCSDINAENETAADFEPENTGTVFDWNTVLDFLVEIINKLVDLLRSVIGTF